MASGQTSQGFVRALKAASDPPNAGGPSKITIAREAWDAASFYVPNKAEVVVEWILSKFLKEKDNEIASNPILDDLFWNLLYDVITSSNTKAQETRTRPLKTWLPALLARIPFAPTVVSLLGRIGDLDPAPRLELSKAVSGCLAVVWPIAAQKLNTEAILECFSAFIDAYHQTREADDHLARIGIIIATSYRNSLWNSSNKKKVYSAFLQSCLRNWLECATQSSTQGLYKSLLEVIYSAGAETLFNLDVLRQARDSRTENVLFDSIAPVLSSTLEISAVLPRLFASYVESIKKFRGALVSTGSTQAPGAANTETQASGMQFLASCLALLDHQEKTVQAWNTKVELLALVDKEGLLDRKQVEAEVLLNRVIGQALSNLDVNPAGDSLSTYAIDSLSALARIDYDIIVPLVPRIFPKLLLSQGSNAPSLAFLDLILAYHTKTRTTNTYIETLLASFSPHEMSAFQGSPRDCYRIALSGPSFEAAHLQSLAKAVQTFLTGSQALQTTEATYGVLKNTWEKFDAAGSEGEERSPKRRKTMDTDLDGVPSMHSQSQWAVGFALSAHIAAVVFSSLPMHAVTEATRQELATVLGDVRDFAHRIVKKAMKVLKKREGDNAWSLSVILSALLRLQYALDISGLITSPAFDDEKLYGRISEAVQDETLLPELLIELFRFLFHSFVKEQDASQTVFDHALTYLEKNFKASKATWAGQVHQLTAEKRGRSETALALLHMIVERWLPAIESFASSEQLERLVRITMSINVTDSDRPSPSGLQAQTLLLQTLHSAQFWELPKIRVVFLKHLNQVISTLDKHTSDVRATSISSTIAAYRLLLVLPVEYFSRSSRAEVAHRALVLDRHIMTAPIYEHLTVLRTFLYRVFSHNNTTDQSTQNLCEALDHLMSLDVSLSPTNDEFISATMDLINCLYVGVFKRSEQSSDVIKSMLRAFEQVNTNLLEPEAFTIRVRSLMRMIRVLESDFKVTSLTDEIQFSMRRLHQTLSVSVHSQVSALEVKVASTADLQECQTNLMEVWHSLLSFGKWLGVTDAHAPAVGARLVSQIATGQKDSSPSWDRLRIAALAILLEEFSFIVGSDRISHLDAIVAAYVSIYRTLESSACIQVDAYLSKTCETLSPTEFARILELLSASFKTDCSPEEHTDLLQISAVLLRDHPQGTLKQMQVFSTQCFNAFAGWYRLIDAPIELRLQTLSFVSQHCTERPAVLRLGDLGGIWNLLTKFLSGSSIHDGTTTLEIFHKIITIVSALVRLRRDLVTHTLPHLGSILRQLLMSLRTVRLNLGAKQTALVTDTLPRWINHKHPLGVEEVKALARLLETLTSKSMVRNNTSSLDTQKAESLVKPFSKHAVHVLKAYIIAMNDPLCLLPSEHRKELQRGLYALCSMVSDHSRDAMMVGALDAGGKTTMKSLWKEYEKQRYVGRG